MADYAVPEKAKKKCLEALNMNVVVTRSVTKFEGTELVWEIERFHELKTKVKYFIRVIEPAWCIKFTKKRRDLTVTLSTSEHGKTFHCCIVYKNKFTSNVITAVEISEGTYEVQFPPGELEDARNENLRKGYLVIKFLFDNKKVFEKILRPCRGIRRVSDEVKMAKRVEWLLEQRMFTDFLIIVEGLEFDVHKALLAARSKFFEFINAFGSKREMDLETTVNAFLGVLNYLYLGQRPTNQDCISEISELAVTLGMDRLAELCAISLREKSNADDEASNETSRG